VGPLETEHFLSDSKENNESKCISHINWPPEAFLPIVDNMCFLKECYYFYLFRNNT
jgi:hypothetical protein